MRIVSHATHFAVLFLLTRLEAVSAAVHAHPVLEERVERDRVVVVPRPHPVVRRHLVKVRVRARVRVPSSGAPPPG